MQRFVILIRAVTALVAGASAAPTLLIAAGVVIVLVAILSLVATLPGLGQQVLCQPNALAVSVVDVKNLPSNVAGFTREQLKSAAIIAQSADDANLDRRAQLIGIMTAIQESELGANPAARTPNSDGDAGIFQQRTLPGWYGTVDQVNDASYAARAFFQGVTATATGAPGSAGGGNGYGHLPGLIDVNGWRAMPLTLAAAAVQRPAAALRTAYAAHEATANEILDALSGTVVTTQAVDNKAGAGDEGTSYELGPVQPQTAAVANRIGPMFGITTVGGWRPGRAEQYDQEGHPAGLALDFMVPRTPAGRATGDKLAAYAQANAAQLNVRYVIWYQRSWNPSRSVDQWRPMKDRGSPRENHLDHVHLSLSPDGTANPAAAAASTCPGLGAAGVADPAAVSTQGWANPASGPITSGFGPRRSPGGIGSTNHRGTDFGGGGCGGPIWAARGGRVTTAGTAGGYGHLIEVDHLDGTATRYGHMYASGILVKTGQTVQAGEVIGQVGSDGNSTGCHLHFEVLINGSQVDPRPVLQQSGVTTS